MLICAFPFLLTPPAHASQSCQTIFATRPAAFRSHYPEESELERALSRQTLPPSPTSVLSTFAVLCCPPVCFLLAHVELWCILLLTSFPMSSRTPFRPPTARATACLPVPIPSPHSLLVVLPLPPLICVVWVNKNKSQ
jgi:hypothetical protein